MSYGLILDFLWNGGGSQTVPVSRVGPLEELRQIQIVDVMAREADWSRDRVLPVEVRKVMSSEGGWLDAHICVRVEP